MNKAGILLITAFLFLYFQESLKAQQWFNGFDNFDTAINWINTGHLIEDQYAYSGILYSRTGNDNPYGPGVKSVFPENIQGKNCMLVVSGYARIPVTDAGGIYVISFTKNGRQVFWQGIDLSKYKNDNRHWFRFADSIKVPADITADGKLVAYLWNNRKKGDIFLDDLKFRFEPLRNPSFLPRATFDFGDSIETGHELIYKNKFYTIFWNDTGNTLTITDNKGNLLVTGVGLFSKFVTKSGDTVVSQNNLLLQRVTKKKREAIVYLRAKTPVTKHRIELLCNDNTPVIRWKELTFGLKSAGIIRNALIFKSGQPVKEVFRANRKQDTSRFQPEYWLDKQGVLFGNRNVSWGIYYAPRVSSIQLDTRKNLLVVNLDYEKDHPFMRFPLAPDSVNWKLDLSTSQYGRGLTIQHEFSLFAGTGLQTLPVVMKNPGGFPAVYIWTEHADYTDVRTNLATYYGNEKITDPDSAVGGFVKYGIPVTKSVFYDNPDSVTNTLDSEGAFQSLECSIMQDSLFRKYLFDIKDRNTEVCLHTPEQFTTTRKRLETALQYMKRNFGSKTWIDHGNNNGPQNNREDLICDGTLKDSPYYALDLWEKYGIKYLNDEFYEEMNTFGGWQFASSIEKPYRGFGDFFPKPDYWQHPTRTGTVYHWPNTKVLYVERNSMWDYFFNPVQFALFINGFGVEVNHCYPARVNRKKAFWSVNEKGEIVSAPGFDKTLRRMKELENKGLLYLSTLGDYLDRRTALDKISYDVLPDGRVKITNLSGTDLRGISFAVKANAVLVNGLKPARKRFADELIYWFDLPKGESAVIRTVR